MKLLLIALTNLILLVSCLHSKDTNSSLAGAADNINELPKRNERRDFCGIELYKAKADAVCGVSVIFRIVDA